MLIYQKTIDRSALRQGFQIPVEFHPLLEMLSDGMPSHGETRDIRIVLDGIEYDAQLKNQDFDQSKYDGHADVVQIRYGENSAFAKRLREIFSATWDYVKKIKTLPENMGRKFVIRIPEEQQEYLAISSTKMPNVFLAECVTSEQKQVVKDEVKLMNEIDFETIEPIVDSSTGIILSAAIHKVRKLDRSIGDSLKRLYDYRCQMTGERVGDAYDALVVEAHHIVPFTQSLNNDTSNIIILSPNYHRIVHRANPEWLAEEKAFKYPNGLVEGLKINKHL